ncbi:MAG: hypothetical protein LBN27_01910 [Prevotellaceae bacterium]|jgi:hypothetical protein|nr:hypothetical protein [Prevotellaceae bacterium]
MKIPLFILLDYQTMIEYDLAAGSILGDIIAFIIIFGGIFLLSIIFSFINKIIKKNKKTKE